MLNSRRHIDLGISSLAIPNILNVRVDCRIDIWKILEFVNEQIE